MNALRHPKSLFLLAWIFAVASLLGGGLRFGVSPLQAQDRVEPRDLDEDGKVDQIAHLGAKGELKVLEVDSNGDAKMDTFQYYKDGVVIRLKRDTDYDGHIDEINVLKKGKPVRQEKLNPKGKPIAILTFDTHGEPLKWQRDTTGDGHFDTIYEYEQGRLRLIIRDTTGDGQTNVWQRFRDGVPFKQESDLNGDGKVDQVLEYDDMDGHVVKSQHDLDGDGRLETVRIYGHNQILKQEQDRDGNGRPDIVSIFENGEIVCEKRDTNGDGKFDVVIHMRKGKVLSMQEDTDYNGKMDKFTEFDRHGQAVIVREIDENTRKPIRLTRFINGKILSVKEFDSGKVVFTKFKYGKPVMQTIDQNGDGQWEQTIIFDKQGQMAKVLIDTNHDGKTDCKQFYENGKLVRAGQDRNYDGKMDAMVQYANGRQIRSLLDNDGDGRFETQIRLDDPKWSKVIDVFDKQGRLKEREFFSDGTLRRKKIFDPDSGTAILMEEYDRRGNIVLSKEAKDGSSKLNLTWYYDQKGNAIRAEQDGNGDGKVDTWYYYNNGQIAMVGEDRNKDGRPDLWDVYDPSGKVVMRKEDLDFDGTADIEKRF